jgi:hypothetical protein
MHTIRTITGSTLYEQLNPAFRIVNFSDSPAVLTIAQYLRQAWEFRPDDTYSCDANGIGKFMREIQAGTPPSSAEDTDVKEGTEEQGEEGGVQGNGGENGDGELASEMAEGKDLQRVTPWQNALLECYNHIFFDVMQFLPNVGLGIGHFHPPSHSHLAISFPISSTSEGGKVLKKRWTTNVLLMPAFLAPGISLRFTTSEGESCAEQEVLGTMDVATKTECWWLRQDVEVTVHVEWSDTKSGPDPSPSESTGNTLGLVEERSTGVAAILAIGVLCDDVHDDAVQVIEELDGEAQIILEDSIVGFESPHADPDVVEVH